MGRCWEWRGRNGRGVRCVGGRGVRRGLGGGPARRVFVAGRVSRVLGVALETAGRVVIKLRADDERVRPGGRAAELPRLLLDDEVMPAGVGTVDGGVAA